MRKTHHFQLAFGFSAVLLCVVFSHTAPADVLELTEQEDWVNLVGDFTTIGFTEYPDGTWIFNQYSNMGVLFVDGADIIACCSKQTFPEDGAGLDGNALIELEFDSPQRWIAVNFPGSIQIDIYNNDELLSSSIFFGSGHGFFGGVISNELFNFALIYDPDDDQVNIDDLHFGYGIPGDINHDDIVGFADLLIVLDGFGPCPEPPDPCSYDMDGNGVVNLEDMIIILNNWGLCDDCDNPDGCPADLDDDCSVGMSDLLLVIGSLGLCPDPDFVICPPDVNFDGTVDTDDIQLILDNWGE